MSLIASVVHLDRKAVQALKINDAYAVHRVVYSLFADVRTSEQKNASVPSGFMYADQGGNNHTRKILLLSNRLPTVGALEQHGRVHSKVISPGLLQYTHYRFQVIVNPTRRDNASRKLIPVKGRDAIAAWFQMRAAQSWGFTAAAEQLEVGAISVLNFRHHSQRPITLAQAHIRGALRVTDRDRFVNSFRVGIGRGRAFGCGLLQIVPIIHKPLAGS